MTEEIYIPYTMKQIKELNKSIWGNSLKIPKFPKRDKYHIYEQMECDLRTFERPLIVLPSSLELTDEVMRTYNLLI